MTGSLRHYINVHWERKDQLFGQGQSELQQLDYNVFRFQYGKGKEILCCSSWYQRELVVIGEAFYVQREWASQRTKEENESQEL